MSRYSFTVETSLLFRIGDKDKMGKEYQAKSISFSCPANWLDFALRKQDVQTGDYLETAFIRSKSDSAELLRLEERFKDNLFEIHVGDGTSIAYFVPDLLTPTLCLYSVEKGKKVDCQDFAAKMKYNLDKSAIFMIHDTEKFFNDLNNQIPKVIPKLSCDMIEGLPSPKAIMIPNKVEYIEKNHKLFCFNHVKAMFYKDISYAYQNEVRIIIPNIHFPNLGIPGSNYAYKSIELELPHLNEYGEIFSLDRNLAISVS